MEYSSLVMQITSTYSGSYILRDLGRLVHTAGPHNSLHVLDQEIGRCARDIRRGRKQGSFARSGAIDRSVWLRSDPAGHANLVQTYTGPLETLCSD